MRTLNQEAIYTKEQITLQENFLEENFSIPQLMLIKTELLSVNREIKTDNLFVDSLIRFYISEINKAVATIYRNEN